MEASRKMKDFIDESAEEDADYELVGGGSSPPSDLESEGADEPAPETEPAPEPEEAARLKRGREEAGAGEKPRKRKRAGKNKVAPEELPAPKPLVLSKEQRRAVSLAKEGRSLFITGCAGTGKSHLIGCIVEELRGLNKTVVVTATTGIAAQNISGCTLHRFAGLPSSIPKQSKVFLEYLARKSPLVIDAIRSTAVLVIDEISMLSQAAFEFVEWLCRQLRREEAFFGGIQVIATGDFFQLPPVPSSPASTSPEEGYCFRSPLWKRHFYGSGAVILTKSFRQDDQGFVDLLMAVREARLEPAHIEYLKRLHTTEITRGTKICCTNKEIERFNEREISLLSGPVRLYHAEDYVTQGQEASIDLNTLLTVPKTLEIKIGMRVMLLKNLDVDAGLVNGSIGEVTEFSEDDSPVVNFGAANPAVKIPIKDFPITSGTRVLASRKQRPLRPCYAISVHKSQGLTLSSAEVFLSGTFSKGQVYVALSRVRRPEDLCIRSLNLKEIKCDPEVVAYYAGLGAGIIEAARAEELARQQAGAQEELIEGIFEREVLLQGDLEDLPSQPGPEAMVY